MNKRNVIVTSFDVMSVLLMAVLLVSVAPVPAFAYVDPSVMTYAIQAFAGIAVALSVVAGVALRRTRKLILKALNIDETTNKIVEEDIHRLDKRGEPIYTNTCSQATSRKPLEPALNRKLAQGENYPSWKRRFCYACVVALFLVFTVFVVAPYEIVAGGEASLIFGLMDVYGVIAIAAAFLLLALSLLLSLLRGRVFQVTLLVVFSLALAAYLQALFLNTGLPSADGNAVKWEDYAGITAISAIVWIAVLAVPLILSRWYGSICRGVALGASLCLVLVQGVGVASLFVTEIEEVCVATQQEIIYNENAVVTQKGLFNVSDKHNVIVFVIDEFDTADLDLYIEKNPGSMNDFNGFTFFRNSVGSMIPTRYAIPSLLTGTSLPEDTTDDLVEWGKNRYIPATFLQMMADSGYSLGIYTDSLMQRESGAEQYIMNMQSEERPKINIGATIQIMWQSSLYRNLPWIVKEPFWFYTDELNIQMSQTSNIDSLDTTPYAMNDPVFYNNLMEQRLSFEDESEKGSFRFIHTLGPHVPHTMNENAKYVGEGHSSREKQTVGSMTIVKEYISQLKEIGAYNNSTIIITADHGFYRPTHFDQYMESPSSPVMLVKPAFQSIDEESTPYQVSQAPTGHLDFQATVLDAMGYENPGYFGGTPIFEIEESVLRKRYYYNTTTDWKTDAGFREYLIEGDVLDMNNWIYTEKIWTFDEEIEAAKNNSR